MLSELKSVVSWRSLVGTGETPVLLRSSLISVAIKAGSLVLAMAVAVVMASRLGATEYGRLAFIQSIGFVLSSLSTLGFRESTNKIVVRYVIRRRPTLLSRYILFGIAVITTASILSGLLAHAVISLTRGISTQYSFSLSSVIGMVVSLALLIFLAPTLVALRRPLLSFTTENVAPRIIVLVGVMALATGGLHLTSQIALNLTIAGNITAAVAVAAIVFISARFAFRMPTDLKGSTRVCKAWLFISLMMMTSPIISLIFSETSIITLGTFASPRDVALYQVSRRLAELASVCGAVATYLALPVIARSHSQSRITELQKTIDVTNAITIIPGLCVVLAVLAEGTSILRMFGPAFADAYTAMLILSLGRLADQTFGPVLEVLLMTGEHAIASRLNLVFAGLNIIANCLLAPLFGAVGVSTATTFVTLLWKASLYTVLRSRCPVETCLPVRALEGLLRSVVRLRVASR